MASPYIAIDLDAKKRIPPASRLAQVSEAQFGWGLVCLWEWCWQQNNDRVTADHLEAFIEADGARLVRALVAFGFAEQMEDGTLRVKGADRYLRINSSKAEAGSTRAAKAQRNEKGHFLPASSTAPAQPADIQQPSSRPPAPVQQTSSSHPALSPTTDYRLPTTKTTPPARADVGGVGELKDGIDAEFLAQRGAAYEWTHQDELALKSKLHHGALEILRRWHIALKRTRYPTCSTVVDLVKKWNDYASEEPQTGPPRNVAAEPAKKDPNRSLGVVANEF